MKQKIKMVIFDMAGTTVNEDNVVYKTLQWAIEQEGIETNLDEVLALGGGKEKEQAIRDIVATKIDNPIEVEAITGKAFANFKNQLAKSYEALDVKAFDGVEEMFSLLRQNNIKIVLNTGYNEATAKSLLKKLGWKEGKDIDLLVTASNVKNGRPAPDMITLAMEKLNIVQAASVAKIGDTGIDIEEGKNANCGCAVGITTGAQSREQIGEAGPDHIIEHIEDLAGILNLEKIAT